MENIQPTIAAEAGSSIFSFIFMMIFVFIIMFVLAYVLAKDQLMSILPPTVATYISTSLTSYLSTLDIYFSTLWSAIEKKEDKIGEKIGEIGEKIGEKIGERKEERKEEMREYKEDRFMRPDERRSMLPPLPPPINERKPLSNVSAKPPTHRQDYGTPSSDVFPPKTINNNLESPSYPADKDGGWCYVGSSGSSGSSGSYGSYGSSSKSYDKGFRTCIEVGHFDKCMSGDIFPSQSICVKNR